jgi:ribosome biogenesis GTPase
MEGRVVADFGREFLVEFADRRQVVCTRKGKRQDATCGDFVEVRLTGSAQGSIERIGTRRNLLYRSDQWREKTLAANVDQVVILLAPKAAFQRGVPQPVAGGVRGRAAAGDRRAQQGRPARARRRSEGARAYVKLGLPRHQHVGQVRRLAAAAAPREQAHPARSARAAWASPRPSTRSCSPKWRAWATSPPRVDSGAHTTTFSRFYRLDRDTAIIDTPGFQSFGLFHLTEDQIGEAMREFRPYLGSCKFNDCSHLNEPGCAVIERQAAGTSPPRGCRSTRC